VKENSIEETIKQLKLMLKVRKEQKEIIECAGGSCINCDPDIRALTESIDILSDYKRVLKENELLRKDIESWKKWEEIEYEERIEMSNKNCELEFDVEKLQKENEELKIKNNAIKRESEAYAEDMIRLDNELNLEKEKSKYEWIRQNCLSQELVNKLYIPIQKVKDKIEELNQKIKYEENEKAIIYLHKQRKILQELIEEREEK
jgi:hypothetical protein